MSFSIQAIDHIVLRVSNLDRALAFYCDALGCHVERRLDDLGLVQLRAGSSLIDLVPVDSKLGQQGGAAAEGRNMDHFCLQILPFDEAIIHAHLKTHGIDTEPSATRYGAQGSGPSIYIQDPDGNTIELKGPPTEPLNQE